MRLIISDACRGLAEAASEIFQNADWQRCVVHFCRNVFSHVPNTKIREVARMLKAIHAQEDRKAADAKSTEIVARLKAMKLARAADLVDPDLLRISVHALAPDPKQQSAGTDHSRDPAANEGRRCLPRRQVSTDASRSEAQTYRIDQMGKRRYLVMDPLLNPAKQEAAA